jgi:serine/threonine-protein kinase
MEFLREDIWQTLQHLLPEDTTSPEEMDQSLRAIKQQFPQYYQEIKLLFDLHEPASDFFRNLNQNILNSVNPREKILQTGDHIGQYQIIRLISTGGMNHVYLAERSEDDFKQRVAVKVLKQNTQNEVVKKQFQREKQILADLQHPNIANIYDGGFTGDGKPYLVMEYVQGHTITEYCDRQRLTIDQRVELFCHVCDAVNHAHQNLIIHKDLKPANILIDQYGNVKLMDFGVAFLMDESTNESHATAFPAFTPAYASPEQLKNKNITTASDIYQLGLLFIQLITGLPPQNIDLASLKKKFSISNHSMIRSQLNQILKTRRLIHGRQYEQKIRGDLQAVAAKSIHEDPEFRYSSVQDLHHDLLHYFHHQPLDIRKPSFGYIFQKYYRRNRIKIKIAGLSFLVILVISTQYAIRLKNERNTALEHARQAQIEARRAESVTAYLKDLIGMANPYLNGKQNMDLQEVLSIGFENLIHSKTLHPVTRADILMTMGEVYRERGNYRKSYQALQEAKRIKQNSLYKRQPEMGRLFAQLSKTHMLLGTMDSARYYIQKALLSDTLHRRLSHASFPFHLEQLGNVLYYETHYQQAMHQYKQVFRMLNDDLNSNPQDRARLLSSIGDTYHQLSQYDSAKSYLHRADRIHRQHSDSANAYMIDDLTMLANTYLRTESLDTAENYIHQALSMAEKIYGAQSGELEYMLGLASRIAKKKQQFKKALHYGKRALEINQKHFGPNHLYTAQRMNTVGLVYRDFGKMQKAEQYFRKALKIKQNHYPHEKKSIAIGQYNLAVTLLRQKQTSDALALLEKAWLYDREFYPAGHPYRAYTLLQLARAYMDAGEMQQARNKMHQAYAIIDSKFDSLHSMRAENLELMAEFSIIENRWEQARQYARQGKKIYAALYGRDHWKYHYCDALDQMAGMLPKGHAARRRASNLLLQTSRLIRQQTHADPYFANQLKLLANSSGALAKN